MSASSAQLHRDALAAGTVLNGYQILGVLGRGGFGITYRASDLLDQSFAIKEFFPRQFAMRSGHDVVVTSESDQAIFVDCRKRFLTEARLLSTLGRNGGTAGVVQVATFFEANNTAYSVMELLAGETLDDVLGAGVSLSPQVLFAMLRGILTPLARVHAAGFLHRDIKPSNILIRPDGQPVLIDFGSARDMRPTANTTYTQVYSGHYAPIEQMIHGAPQGPYSDIYSVGGVAYRAIGGKLIDARAPPAGDAELARVTRLCRRLKSDATDTPRRCCLPSIALLRWQQMSARSASRRCWSFWTTPSTARIRSCAADRSRAACA